MSRSRFDIRAQPGFGFITLFTFFALYLPIAALVVYSFNGAESLSQWGGFSSRWFVAAWQNSAVQDAAIRSLVIALWAAGLATVAALMAALATTRTAPYRGQTLKYALINQPLMVPEIVTAVALLIVFSRTRLSAFPSPIYRSARDWKAWILRWSEPQPISTPHVGRRFAMSPCRCCGRQ
jgi:spermidine/putrescine transport system permease protein